jgi:excisionase family DNA binding protein
MDNGKFMDIRVAADFLSVSVATLYGWVHQRRIPFRKHGKKLIFFRPDLQSWSDSHAVKPSENDDLADKLLYGPPLERSSSRSSSLTSGQSQSGILRKG